MTIAGALLLMLWTIGLFAAICLIALGSLAWVLGLKVRDVIAWARGGECGNVGME